MDQVNVQRVLGARDLVHGARGAMFAVLLKLSQMFVFALRRDCRGALSGPGSRPHS
jgi:uncharacterized sodium:solute symporter family permease YidK